MDSVYLLVEWLNEGRFSSVSHNSLINEEEKQLPPKDLIGKTVRIKWGKKEYKGTVHQYGTKIDMDHEVGIFAKSVGAKPSEANDNSNLQCAGASKRKSNGNSHESTAGKRSNENTYAELSNVLTQMDMNMSFNGSQPDMNIAMERDTSESPDDADEITLLKSRLDASEKRAKKYKDLAKARKREIEELKLLPVPVRNERHIDLGNNVLIPKDKLDTIRALSDTPNIFARNLMRVLFTREEMVGKSLFGKACNILKDAPVLQSIDSTRRDAIIIFTMKVFGQEVVDVNKKKQPLLSDLRRSMGDFLREQTQKFKKCALEN